MKKLIYGFLIADVLIFAFLSLTGAIGSNIDAKVSDFNQAIADKAGVLVDVRTPEEYDWERIDGAINIDWKSDDFANKIQELDKKKPVLIYCRSGARASRARRRMKQLGFSNVINLGGGILKWKKEGMPTKKSPDYREDAHAGGEEGC